MTQIAEAFVRIRPDTDQFGRELRTDVSRDLRRTERSLASSNRELSRFSRGALVGTGALGQLGRAAAFASLSFIGGAGLVVGIRSTVAAAAEAEVVETQLANVLEQQGVSFEANRVSILRRTQALSEMSGFDDELALRTFTTFIRRTEDLSESFRLNALAVDVARGANLGLEQATKLVLRASVGQARGLSIIGVAAEKGATGVELLESISRKFAGSAEAYGRTAAGAQERFAVAVENTQEIIGVALLPSLTKLLDKATEWLNDSENQVRLQVAVEDAAGKTARTVEFLADAYGKASRAVEIFQDLDPFGGRSGLDIARESDFGPLGDLFDVFTLKPDRGWEDILAGLSTFLSASLPGSRNLDALEALRGARTTRTPPDLPDELKGSAFLGTTATDAQRRAIELARTGGSDTDAELEALRAEEAADRKALAFATRMMQQRGRNQKAFADQAIRLQAEITASQDRIAQITEERAANARDARERIKEANIEASLFVIDLLDQARDARLEDAIRAAQERADRLDRLTRVPEELELRTQIAEARAEKEEQVIPFLQREAQALERQIGVLKRDGASLVQILQAKANLARTRRQIRDIDRQERDDFSVQDFFSLAAGEFAALGSNVGAIDVALSPQEAGGAAVRAARSVSVNQHFYGQQPNPAQALQQASQAARALR